MNNSSTGAMHSFTRYYLLLHHSALISKLEMKWIREISTLHLSVTLFMFIHFCWMQFFFWIDFLNQLVVGLTIALWWGAGGDQTSNWPLDIYTYLESGPNVVVTTCSWSPWPHPAPATSTHTQATRHAAPGTQTLEADWLNKIHSNTMLSNLVGAFSVIVQLHRLIVNSSSLKVVKVPIVR